MTSPAGAEIVELYERAVARTRALIAGVRTDQRATQTPCTKWDVQDLLDHLSEAPGFYAQVLTGRRPTLIAHGEGGLAAFDAATGALIRAARAPGTLTRPFASPQGTMNGAQFVTSAFLEALVHGWDLAQATGQDTTLDPELVDVCYDLFAPHMDGLRPTGAFGFEVAVSAGASKQQRLLAIMGRQG